MLIFNQAPRMRAAPGPKRTPDPAQCSTAQPQQATKHNNNSKVSVHVHLCLHATSHCTRHKLKRHACSDCPHKSLDRALPLLVRVLELADDVVDGVVHDLVLVGQVARQQHRHRLPPSPESRVLMPPRLVFDDKFLFRQRLLLYCCPHGSGWHVPY